MSLEPSPDAAPPTGESRYTAWVSRSTVLIGALATAVIAILIPASVLLRAFTGRGIRGVSDLVVLFMVAAAFLGFAAAESSNTHVRVTVLTQRLQSRTAAIVRATSGLLLAAVSGVMAYAACLRALDSLKIGEHVFGVVRFPVWPIRFTIAIGLGLLALVALGRSFAHLRDIVSAGDSGA